jgi:hypothetical protein
MAPQGHGVESKRRLDGAPAAERQSVGRQTMSAHRLEKPGVLAFVFLVCIGCATNTRSASSTIAANSPLLQTIDLETWPAPPTSGERRL